MSYTFYMPGPPVEVTTMTPCAEVKMIRADQSSVLLSGYQEPFPSIDGWMDISELNWLFSHSRIMSSVVEIGCWMGRSTHALLSGCHGTVFAVDHFKGNPSERDGGAHQAAKTKDIGREFMWNVGHFPNLYMMEMDSVEAASYFDDLSVDMVFIDGGHDYNSIWSDLNAWWPKCRRLLCGHDAGQDGVPVALNKFEEIAGPHKRAGSIWHIERAAT